MSNGSVMDYDFKQKRHWRRTVHNRIVELLEYQKIKPAEAVVLYLAGAQNFDGELFVEHGFLRRNLIAIEKDRKIARGLRADSVLTIHGDLGEIVANFTGLRIDVVFADFCCGLDKPAFSLLSHLAANPFFVRAINVFNLMRGRDAAANAIREQLQMKHRGAMAVSTQLNTAVLTVAEKITMELGVEFSKEQMIAFTNNLGVNVEKFMSSVPYYRYSYRSISGQVFDSAVFENCSVFTVIRVWLLVLMQQGLISREDALEI